MFKADLWMSLFILTCSVFLFIKNIYVQTVRFLKCVWPFYNIMHERFKIFRQDIVNVKS